MIPYFTFQEIHLGIITIQVWGLMASIGFLVALFLSLKEARKNNINKDDIWNVMILALVGMIVGSKIFYIVSDIGILGAQPRSFGAGLLEYAKHNLSFGFSFIGGASFAGILLFIYARYKKINFWKLADTITPGAIVAIVIIRTGCFLIYDHFGKITELPWGRIYLDGTIRHPVILYHIISALAILFIVWYLRKRNLKNGLLSLYFVIYYLTFRFLTDFLRCSDLNICDAHYLNLTYTQWFILVLILPVIYLLNQLKRKE